VLKAQDANLRFVFLTGVTKFSQVSLFSGLNQLNDLTLDARYATLCGYTQHDLETTFAAHLAGVDGEELRRWYNGHGFLGEAVYNPFYILLFIAKGRSYRNYWFETGKTPGVTSPATTWRRPRAITPACSMPSSPASLPKSSPRTLVFGRAERNLSSRRPGVQASRRPGGLASRRPGGLADWRTGGLADWRAVGGGRWAVGARAVEPRPGKRILPIPVNGVLGVTMPKGGLSPQTGWA
jgi:hypothetical protein